MSGVWNAARVQASSIRDRLAARLSIILVERTGVAVLFACCLFLATVALVQPVDNQNTYFLQGLAWANFGYLPEDWLASSRSPFVVFSAIIAALQSVDFLAGVRVLEFLLVLAFSYSILLLLESARPAIAIGRNARYLVALLILLTCLFLPMLMHGLAGQYLLGLPNRAFNGTFLNPNYFGLYLQPSEFGVLLILSVALFVAEMRMWPYLLAALAGVFHQSYLMPGAFLVIAYCGHDIALARRPRLAIGGALAALAIVTPIVVYSLLHFGAGDPEVMEQGRAVLAEVRIPHHALPNHWFDKSQGLKLAFLVCAIALAWFVNRRLGYVMAVATGLAVAVTALALVAGSNAFYLLFPWRISTVLMPLAVVTTCIGLARVVLNSPLGRFCSGMPVRIVMIVLIVAPALFVLSQRAIDYRVRMPDDLAATRSPQFRDSVYLDLVDTVRGDGAPGQVYLNNPARYQSFRILSGLPTYVDFKSHPYDAEGLVDWLGRLRWAQELYSGRRGCDAGLFREFRDRGITHIVIDAVEDGIDGPGMVACLRQSGQDASLRHRLERYSVIGLY